MSLFTINSYATSAAAVTPAVNPAPRNRAPTAPTPSAAEEGVTELKAKSKAEAVKLDNAVAAINEFLKPVASSLEFSIDKDSGRTVVQVIDTTTNDIIRQFPSKQALAISNELSKLQGMLVQDKA